METLQLLGSALGFGLLAGIRLYATVLALGLAIRFGLWEPDPAMSHLRVLADPMVLAAAAVAFVLEFISDKVPWVDSLWDSVHTFIRPLGAAILGATAFGSMDPRCA